MRNADLKALALEIGEIERDARGLVSAADIAYIRRIRRLVFSLEIVGRLMIFMVFWPWVWGAGVIFLASAKIISNLEIGHNVLHGQYDEQKGKGANEVDELDAVATADNWREAHNHHHHLYTGIKGLDNDITILRVSPHQPWKWLHLFQPLLALLSALFSQWAVALQNLRLGDWASGAKSTQVLRKDIKDVAVKVRWHLLKDYLLFPVLAGPYFLHVLIGNFLANGLRNVWIWLVFLCGHCVAGVQHYEESVLKTEIPEHWYLRQITSTANFSSGSVLRVLTGHLGYHIEHHLFPDVPAMHYPEISGRVRKVCLRYGIPYNTRHFSVGVLEVCWRLVRLSFPGGGSGRYGMV